MGEYFRVFYGVPGHDPDGDPDFRLSPLLRDELDAYRVCREVRELGGAVIEVQRWSAKSQGWVPGRADTGPAAGQI